MYSLSQVFHLVRRTTFNTEHFIKYVREQYPTAFDYHAFREDMQDVVELTKVGNGSFDIIVSNLAIDLAKYARIELDEALKVLTPFVVVTYEKRDDVE